MRNIRSLSICFCFISAAAFLNLAFISNGQAAAPFAKDQAPGFYRMMVGRFEVTALSDGWIDMAQTHLGNAPEAEIQKLWARSFISGPKVKTSSNAYLINTGSKLILVDTGNADALAGALGPNIGFVMKNLRASGYDPAQVDAVLITHMHQRRPDFFGLGRSCAQCRRSICQSLYFPDL